MKLLLQHRWEQALIAATIEAASRRCPTCFLGRTAIQKMLFFMKVLGMPMRYSFDIHHYGPFCQNVMSDMEWLLADDVIRDTAPENRYSNYRTGPAWAELAPQFSDKIEQHRHIIDDVCAALGDLSPETLELIATLDFSFRWIRARGGNGPWRPAAIAKFKQIKKNKFNEDEINGWYDTLVEARLIEE